MEIPHHARVGVGSEHRTEHVVGRTDIGYPVAQRLVDGILERPSAGVDRHDFGSQQTHTLDIHPLPAHVLFAHVDHALESEKRCGARGRDAMLPRPGLGDDALLAHLTRE